MLTTLTMLIYLLDTDFGAQQTPHLSPGLTEARTCLAKSLKELLFANISHLDGHCAFSS